MEVARHHARLASGCWPGSSGRDWLPAGFLRKVSRLYRFSFPELLGAMSEHLFAWRTTTTARLTDDAEAMGNDLDPVLCTVGPATAHRRPYAQLLGRLFPTDLPWPAGPTFRLSATELLSFRERVQDGIGMPGAMAAVARPGRSLAKIDCPIRGQECYNGLYAEPYSTGHQSEIHQP